MDFILKWCYNLFWFCWRPPYGQLENTWWFVKLSRCQLSKEGFSTLMSLRAFWRLVINCDQIMSVMCTFFYELPFKTFQVFLGHERNQWILYLFSGYRGKKNEHYSMCENINPPPPPLFCQPFNYIFSLTYNMVTFFCQTE